MKKIIFDSITKEDFKKINEDDIVFITNPGRMGDEDGIYFIIKNDNKYISYRVSGWMYGTKTDSTITFQDAQDQFPKWMETWENWNNVNYKGKYKYVYMGFGNGLCVDNNIYNDYYPYLLEEAKKSKDYKEDSIDGYDCCININIWDKAIVNMCTAKNIEIQKNEQEEKKLDIPDFLKRLNEDE